MDFRILGPLEVLDQGRHVSIRRGKDQALLAYLLLHPNEVIASERLVDELWGERPPATAAKILQNAVSQLRRALGDDRLLTRPPGYILQVEPGELDLERFERLAERGPGNRGRKQGAVVRIDPRTDRVAETIHLGYKPQGLAMGAGALWVTVGHGDLALPF